MTGAFNELHPIIGIASACAALAINRPSIYRDRKRLHSKVGGPLGL